jgi:hypothetical protein
MNEIVKSNSGIVKYTPEQILSECTKPAVFKEISSLPAAIASNHKSLAVIKKEHGEKLPIAILKVWLINLNDFLNLSRKMTPQQIEETSLMVYEEFYYLKTSDIALIFKRIKTGFYGPFYESIDGMKILDIFYKYGQERVGIFLDNIDREHDEVKYKYQL